jgi:hypothetical protein
MTARRAVQTPARRVRAADEEPEHRNERRRFLIWALMVGAVPPQRVTERIVPEVKRELAGIEAAEEMHGAH